MAELPEPLVLSQNVSSEPKTSILLVDDNSANLLSLRAVLEELGQNLVEARSGEEALQRMQTDEFAVILLDVLMPGIGGFETAKMIRGNNRSRHTPIIFLTASDMDRSQIEEGYTLGAVDFLVKPLLPIVLQAKVRGFVELFQDKHRTRREAEQLRLLIHGTAEYAIVMLDPDGHIVTWNLGGERLKGYKAEEIVGQHFSRFYPQDAIDRGWPAHVLTVAAAEGRFEDEGWRVRKDGSRFWANVVITALRDGAGDLKGYSKITRDLTEPRQAEEKLKSFAAHLQRSNRELEQFASVASHDLQEPLRKIQTFGDRLQTKCGEALGEQGREYLDRMQAAAARMRTLINDLLTFSRVTIKAQPFEPVALTQVAQEVVADLEGRIQQTGGRVEVGELPTVDADPLQMRQLLQNLIGNGLKFHRPEEPPVVQVEGRLLHDPTLPVGGNGQGLPLCQIVVRDNGIGFEEEYRSRIFQLFQRLHGRNEYEGTGIGLAVCQKIVERHGGTITANSTPGHGATFLVTLPARQPEEGNGHE